jgi:hypothetical protein
VGDGALGGNQALLRRKRKDLLKANSKLKKWPGSSWTDGHYTGPCAVEEEACSPLPTSVPSLCSQASKGLLLNERLTCHVLQCTRQGGGWPAPPTLTQDVFHATLPRQGLCPKSTTTCQNWF